VTESQVSQPHNAPTSPEQNVQLAMEILNKGASSRVERVVVQKAFDYVQQIKRGPKHIYGPRLRYGALTLDQRNAAKKAAKHLKRALTTLETWPGYLEGVAGYDLSISQYDLAWLENMQRDLQIVGNVKLQGSSFDDRPLRAVQVAVGLLKAAGKDVWTTTRDKDADQLAAALWGEPDKDFQEWLLRFSHLPAVRRERAKKRVAVPG
jgi:hypothetical protein